METLLIILPYSLALAVVGLLESLLTASIVDDMTETESDKNKESRGQGIANMVAGCFGGMAGCAMIGQSVINVKSGGRGRATQRQEKMVTTEELAKAAGVHYETKVIRGEPGPSIVKYANENNYDLIIVGSRGLNVLQEMVLGSVSHKVAKRANCPVMIVK